MADEDDDVVMKAAAPLPTKVQVQSCIQLLNRDMILLPAARWRCIVTADANSAIISLSTFHCYHLQPWCEKFRPRSIDDIAYQDEVSWIFAVLLAFELLFILA
jgi:hypothetical protein